MSDVHSKTTRSYNMQQIKGKNTKPELLVRKYLYSQGFRYRLNERKLTGRPDMVLRSIKTVIFINGCFWHGHENCKYFSIPKTRTEWWIMKIIGNQLNDVLNRQKLVNEGWKVIIIWECELKHTTIEKTFANLFNALKNRQNEFKQATKDIYR